MSSKKNKIPEDQWIPLKSFPSRLYAEMVKEVLDGKDIPSIIKGEDVGILGTGSYGTSSPGRIVLWVLERDFDRCQEISTDMLDHI
ncbi:hypothetical protein BMS3Abin05_02649 [bacterium BMS3Abin05]|nr:hypothetical protein BMS3Abin05_02649 [bacterium BMS3Abin05]GBE26342.1 hypothetical protein BMS3Bbin03_00254 [bacterium BMS3Bbin03]HDZ12377.1 hypothetical protein [Bacteroidota bacterium]